MRMAAVVIASILALAFDSSFGGILSLRSVGSVTPLAMPCLVVFIALFAPTTTALMSAIMFGILVDLSPGQGELAGGAHLVGPYALGYFVTALLIVKVRNVVFRRRITTIAMFSTGSVIVVGATHALVLITRGMLPWTPSVVGGGFMGLVLLLGTAIYTGLLAVPLGWCLLSTIGLWRFHSPTGRRATWR